MCTTTKQVTISEVRQMANKFMNTTFTYQGKEYNMLRMGWSFEFNTRKRALGLCSGRRKTVYLSQWVILNSHEPMETWIDTMLHEIAHAIDFSIRGRSSHDWRWRSIALAIGCNGERCASVEHKEDVKSKYTLKCNSCDFTAPSHKKRKRQGSCPKCSGGRFNPKYLIEQVQNY